MKNTTQKCVVGAFMDEYQYAVKDLKAHICDIKNEHSIVIIGKKTKKDAVPIRFIFFKTSQELFHLNIR